MNYLSDLDDNGKKNTIIVAIDSGKILGKLCRISIDTNAKKVSGISFRRILSSDELFLKMDRINRIGADIIFVENEFAAEHLTDATSLPGEDLKEFQGTLVYNISGKAIGALTDIGFLPTDWTINKLYLDGNRVIDVDANGVTMNHDHIVVSDASNTEIKVSTESEGLLAGLYGPTTVRQASILLQRALRGTPVSSPPATTVS